MEQLLAEDFRFTSPQDDHIDKAAYFERCWPFSEKVRDFDLQKIFPEGNEAFVLYECHTKEGKPFKNVELLSFDRGKLKEVQVFFGFFTEQR